MNSPYKSFLFLNQTFDPEKHIVATYKLQTDEDFFIVAGGVAAESSIGTWTFLTTQNKENFNKLCAKVFFADSKTGIIKIAYPLDLFEKGNIPQLLSSIAGNIFGLKEVKKLKLLDLELPKEYVISFPGPALGIDGIKKLTGIKDRPLLGSIIKPKVGLSAKDHTRVAMEVYKGGIDFVKDDENLTDQVFNPFYERVELITNEMKKEKYLQNGDEKIYAFNITAPSEVMKERAEFVKSRDGNCIMIDILTVGFSGVQYIKNQKYGMIIHGHRAMHAALTRDPDSGISMLVLAKIARLVGIDSLHTGTIVGKMEGGEEEVLKINKFLTSDWFGLSKVLPVASGGLSPLSVPNLIKYFGNDVLLNFGGGIHGHPKGSLNGAKAVIEAVEAVKNGETLDKYSENHEDLKIALNHWKY